MDNILKRLDALKKSRENDEKNTRKLEEIQEELDDLRTNVKALVSAEDEKPSSRPVVESRAQTPAPDTSKLESRLIFRRKTGKYEVNWPHQRPLPGLRNRQS